MRILMLLPQAPFPPDQGAKIRNLHLVRSLCEVHELHLVCFAPGPPRQQQIEELQRHCASLHWLQTPRRRLPQRLWRLLTSAQPDLASRLWSEEARQRIIGLVRSLQPQVVHASNLELAPYLFELSGPALVLDEHNVESLLQLGAYHAARRSTSAWHRALYSWVQWRRLAAYEQRACARADLLICVSDADAAALAKLAPGTRPEVIPNSVDTDRYRPTGPHAGDEPPSLLFSGTFAYRPNREAARWLLDDSMPLVWKKRPEVRILMVGYEPPRWLVKRCMNDPRVAVVGGVEDDRPYLARADVCVLPITWGGGSRLKALVAMAAGVPIVSTPLGMQGLAAAPERHYLSAQGPADFADRICQLLDDHALRQSLAQEARCLAEDQYDWRRIAPAVQRAYARLGAS